MTAPAPLAFPGSRALAGWWRQLLPFAPKSLWVGYLFLHQVEALVRVTQAHRIDPVQALVLKALRVQRQKTLAALDGTLHFGRQLLARVLVDLESKGLLAGSPDAWNLTPQGAETLASGKFAAPQHERRIFAFREADREGEPPHYLEIRSGNGVAWGGPDGRNFDLEHLLDCVNRPADWKRRHRFPLDVEQVLQAADGKGDGLETVPLWKRVVVDRPERLAVVLMLMQTDDTEGLIGIALRPEGWTLTSPEPILRLGPGWGEPFPGLAATGAADWLHAWRAWCQPRGLAAADVEACGLALDGCRLLVEAPARLIERLRAARSDALKGEAWLLAGEGPLRPAAQVVLQGRS